jgi:hypothetical protein
VSFAHYRIPDYLGMTKLAQVAALPAVIPEMPDSNLGQNTKYLAEDFHDFPQSRQMPG